MLKKITIYIMIIFCLATVSNAGLYKFEYHKKIPFGGDLILDIQHRAGEVIIRAHSENFVVINAIKYVRAENQNEAETLSEYIDINARQEGNRINIITEHKVVPDKKPSFWDNLLGDKNNAFGSVDFDISVPLHCETVLKSISGNVNIEDTFGSVKVRNSVGELALKNITGDIWLESSGGKIVVTDCEGDISISAPGSETFLENITGSLDIRSTSGNKIGKNMFGRTKIVQTSGDIDLENLNGDLRIKSNSGKIDIVQRTGTMNIVGNSIDVSVMTHLDSMEDYFVESGSGNIKFLVPQNSAARVKLETIRGAINTMMPIQAESISKTKVSGTFGEGGPYLILISTTGDISLGMF
jgi:hypothetical protein